MFFTLKRVFFLIFCPVSSSLIRASMAVQMPLVEYKLPVLLVVMINHFSCQPVTVFARVAYLALMVTTWAPMHQRGLLAGLQKLFCLQLTNCLPIKQVSTVKV